MHIWWLKSMVAIWYRPLPWKFHLLWLIVYTQFGLYVHCLIHAPPPTMETLWIHLKRTFIYTYAEVRAWRWFAPKCTCPGFWIKMPNCSHGYPHENVLGRWHPWDDQLAFLVAWRFRTLLLIRSFGAFFELPNPQVSISNIFLHTWKKHKVSPR